MKHAAPLLLVLAALLTAAGLFLRHRDPATAYTDHQEAWRLYEEGERHLQAFRHPEADSLLSQALALDPGLAPAHAALGEMSLALGQIKRAAAHLAQADSLTATIEEARARLLVQIRLANLRPSRYFSVRDSLLQRARDLAPREIAVLTSLAMRATQEDDAVLAEATWKQILDLNPNHASAYNYLGYLYLRQGRYEEAEAAMRRYAFVAPDLANPHDSLGEVLMTIGRYEEAERELRLAMQKQQDFPYSPMNLAFIHLARGEVPKAVDLFEQVLQVLDGTPLGLQFERAAIQQFFNHRLSDLFETYSARYLAHEPDPRNRAFVEVSRRISQGEPLAALAQLDSLQADHEQAAWYPEEPLAAPQVQFALLRLRALAAEQLGLHDVAAELLRQALVIGQDFPPHQVLNERIRLAFNLIPLGALDEARQQVHQALTVNPRRAAGFLVAASIEATAGNYDEARHLLDTVEQILARAVPEFPVLQDALRLRERLPDPEHI